MLLPKAMSMSMVLVTTRGHVDVCGVCSCWKPYLLMSVVHAAKEGHVYVHSLYGCLRFVLPPEAMLASMAYVATEGMSMPVVYVVVRGHVEVHVLCCHQRPCLYVWVVLLPGAMLVPMAWPVL